MKRDKEFNLWKELKLFFGIIYPQKGVLMGLALPRSVGNFPKAYFFMHVRKYIIFHRNKNRAIIPTSKLVLLGPVYVLSF